jgi:hypothetical protein
MRFAGREWANERVEGPGGLAQAAAAGLREGWPRVLPLRRLRQLHRSRRPACAGRQPSPEQLAPVLFAVQ